MGAPFATEEVRRLRWIIMAANKVADSIVETPSYDEVFVAKPESARKPMTRWQTSYGAKKMAPAC